MLRIIVYTILSKTEVPRDVRNPKNQIYDIDCPFEILCRAYVQ